MTQSIFSNCSTHYEIEIIFEVCLNLTDPCKSISKLETAITIAYVDYYSSTALFLIACLINIYCLITILPIFLRMENGSKKKYIFFITRCIAGLMAATAWLFIQCIFLRFIAPTENNFPYYVIALALYIGSTYVLLGSYVGMAGVLYLGVLNPIAFNQHLTLRVVYIAVTVVFLVSIAISIPLATLQTAIIIPTTVKCTEKTCAPLITLINIVLVCGSLLITIIALSFVLISLKRHRKQFKKQETVSNTSLNSAIRLLSFTLFAVLLIAAAEVIPIVFMEIKRHEGITSGCYWFYHSNQVISEVSFSFMEAAIWSVALILDPLTNVIFDRTVSIQVTNQMKSIRKSFSRLTGKRKSLEQKIKGEEEEIDQGITTQSVISSCSEN